jgi:rare lipoprotein A
MLKSLALAGALLCALFTPSRADDGIASWYGAESGRWTASGARFDPEGPTCAMRTRAWRWVTVTVIATGRSARCYVNDFGPARYTHRLIDVSHGMARSLGLLRSGTAQVRVQ